MFSFGWAQSLKKYIYTFMKKKEYLHIQEYLHFHKKEYLHFIMWEYFYATMTSLKEVRVEEYRINTKLLKNN